ncbi:phage tail tape measure protein [Pararhizobium haloflavum]|uniref:phage tail tape measure protein n=1 Tax=Pararhizobium haloflavum TaxID=2037914 RepID=UPI000C18AC32|nr:phage tail tape measure protein [Pararhizobium haloflavum]
MNDDVDLTYRVGLNAEPFQTVMDDLEARSGRFAGALSRAFRSAVIDGRDLEGVLRGLAGRLSDIALDAGTRPLETLVSGAIANLTGRIMPFADGGVVSAPSYFPMGGDLGLMGEAGPEAILPLSRGSDGRLGIASGNGAGGAPIVFNVTTQDAESFRRSEGQITAMLARAVGRGGRSL